MPLLNRHADEAVKDAERLIDDLDAALEDLRGDLARRRQALRDVRSRLARQDDAEDLPTHERPDGG